MCLLRGDTMRALDGRDAVLFVEVVEERRVASRRPGAGDVGNEQKARIIKEYEMALHFAAFLYVARVVVSRVEPETFAINKRF